MKYTKPTMEVKEFRAKETVASLSDWLEANGMNTLATAVDNGTVSYYTVS